EVWENGWALRFAALLAGPSRLGRPRFDELTRGDLETLASNDRLVGIDVAGVYGAHELRGMRGHGYWVANNRVSSDVLLSMIYPFDPTWRGLVHAPGRSIWTFPDDYPQRVGDAVYEAAPELRRDATAPPPPRWTAVRRRGVQPPRRRAVRYCLMFMVTPEAPSVNLTPRLVDLSVTRTPFWFCIVETLPPPPTVAPAP